MSDLVSKLRTLMSVNEVKNRPLTVALIREAIGAIEGADTKCHCGEIHPAPQISSDDADYATGRALVALIVRLRAASDHARKYGHGNHNILAEAAAAIEASLTDGKQITNG